IPLPQNTYPDRLIWHFTKHGEYTVKSGYYILKGGADMSRPSSSNVNPNHILFWKVLWKMKLPARVLSFGWRFARDILPVKANLARRRICVETSCDICGGVSESWFHAFISCPFSQAVWRLGGYAWNIHDPEPLHPLDWLVSNQRQLQEEKMAELLVTLWCLWRHRLDHRHNQATTDPLRTHHMIRCHIEASSSAFQVHIDPMQPPPLQQRQWERPPDDFLKLNFDSGRCGAAGTGMGGLIRDSDGRCQAWFSSFTEATLDPELGEALAARKILELARAMQIPKIILEGDCLTVIQALADRSATYFSSLGNILQDSIRLMEEFDDCRLSHTRRQFNGAAHYLAKRRCRSHGYGTTSLPAGLGPLLLSD
ncbi:hypothetical protein M569_15629, partial [Genlisea aurea]